MPAFVGRAAELAQLERLFTVGDGPAALIVGDPGSGKTRLLAELKLRATHLGDQLQVTRARFIEGACGAAIKPGKFGLNP